VAGEGYHRRAGGPHAEVVALSAAGKKAKGADLYVTLEPCCHHGRTPPCTDAIAAAGIRRVFVGARDPNPQVSGRGMKALRAMGVEVVQGILEDACAAINEPYNKFMREGMPHVTAKAASTLDGKIAAADGSSRWITNGRCRRYVHELRGRSDAVMVGAGTVLRDDPSLSVRLSGWRGREPIAVVVDGRLRIPARARLLRRPKGSLIVLTTRRANPARMRRIESLGHRVIVCRQSRGGLVDLRDALSALGAAGVLSVMIEGGGRLFSSLVKEGLVDRMVVCIAPKLLGGRGLDMLPGIACRGVGGAVELCDVTVKAFDDNVVVEGAVRKGRVR
jgi:diaminohydroxyphosphoribosylaminopyrimidine deaminase/5-amino-6-(5-phosphoribosylamino)uracil reductase